MGRAAREAADLKVRQPLASAQFVTRSVAEADAVRRMSDIIESELNVKSVKVLEGAGEVVTYVLNPLPAVLGKKLGKDFPAVQKTLREGAYTDVERWAKALLKGDVVSVEVNGQAFEVTSAEVEVKQKSSEGFAVADDGGYLAAVDTRLNDDLIMEGLAREVVRRVQSMRKDADFNISDQIDIRYVASERLGKAIKKHSDYIKTETLAKSMRAGEPKEEYHHEEFSFDGETLTVGVRRIE